MKSVPFLQSISCIKILSAVLFCTFVDSAVAQIRPPGYEREVQAMEERKRTSILDIDSVTVVDTVTLFDPTTYEETMKIIPSNLSWRDYMTLRVGISNPDLLLNGAPMTIDNLRTFEKMVVQWNASETKLDTIRQE